MGFTFVKIQPGKNEDSKKIDPYCYAIKTMVSGKLETVGHIPREVSKHTYSYTEEGGCVDYSVLSKCYCSSPIPGGGLVILIMMTYKPKIYHTSENEGFHCETLVL